ncbi:MAG: CpaF family protein, partial [Anaerolineales bacterium]
LHEMLGYGPLQPLLDDPEVSEVMVNGPQKVYVEKHGQLIRTDVTFEDEAHVIRVIDRILVPLGRRVDSDSPTVDARLPDGSRVNAVVRPVAIDGPSITIRKFRKEKLSIPQLVEFGTLTQNMADFLKACVLARLNILISGGTGSGKTTLLNLLSGFIPENERILTIEDAAELQLEQDHVLRLETKPPSEKGGSMTTIRDLVRNSLRMRPDRIIVGECRGGEAMDMLQAMNTGHDGSLTTLHANSPRDALSRLETMVLMAGMELPLKVVRQQISSAIDLIVQQSRLKDGTRRITAITEVAGMEGDTVVLTDIFKFDQTGIGENGKVLGDFKPTGMRPLFSPRLEAAGYKLEAELFGSTIADMLASRQRR